MKKRSVKTWCSHISQVHVRIYHDIFTSVWIMYCWVYTKKLKAYSVWCRTLKQCLYQSGFQLKSFSEAKIPYLFQDFLRKHFVSKVVGVCESNTESISGSKLHETLDRDPIRFDVFHLIWFTDVIYVMDVCYVDWDTVGIGRVSKTCCHRISFT